MKFPTYLQIGNSSDGFVVFDASLRETHRRDSEVTDFPVEQGANISDHVRPKPIQLEVLGIVSQTPIPRGAEFISPTRVHDARQAILTWRDSGTLVDVITYKEWYRQMVIKQVVETSDCTNGNDFEVEILLQQLSTATLQFVDDPATTSRGAKTKIIGTQPAPATLNSAAFVAISGQP